MQTKLTMVLNALREQSLNRFEAERLGDHCLNSTLSRLRAKGHQIGFSWEIVPTRFRAVKVKRYFLLANSPKTDSGSG